MSVENTSSSKADVLQYLFAAWAAVTLAVVAGCASRSPSKPIVEPGGKEQPAAVTAAIHPEKSFDHRPYEFIWYEPDEEHPPLVDFDRPLGWTATTEPGCMATFERSQEEQLWGSFVGKIVYGGTNVAARAVIRPPEPIPIREHFDTVTMWIHSGAATNRAVDVGISLLIRDDAGQERALPFPVVGWKGWRLCSHRPAEEDLAGLQHPCFLVGLEVRHGVTPSPRVIYVDSLAFFIERMTPLPEGSQRPLNLAEARDDQALSFPTSPLTVVPAFDADAVRTTIAEEGRDHYVLGSRSPSGALAYHVIVTNQLPLVRTFYDDALVGDWFVGGGIHGMEEMHGELVVSRIEKDAVRLEYASGATYSFSVAGASLLVDATCRAGAARYVDSGSYRGKLEWQPLDLPEVADRDLPVLFGWVEVPQATTNDAEAVTPVFFSQVGDWYRSQSSEMRVVAPDALKPGRVRALYHARSNGIRNDVRERIVLTLSTKVQDVLPSISNPASTRFADLQGRVWAGTTTIQTFDELRRDTEHLASLGITNIVQGHPEVFWQGVGEDVTLRVRATPRLGGDEALRDLLQAQAGVGWRTGLQMNYLEISALNRFWSSDVVLRDGANRWRQMKSGRYGVKPGLGLTFQARVLPEIKTSFAPNLSYVSFLTVEPPWVLTDFDERVAEAGMFAAAYARIGEMLEEEARQLEVPVVGDGGGELFYAGLVDAVVEPGRRRLVHGPYLPLMSLYRLQPLCLRYGLGPMAQVAGSDGREPADRVRALDRYLAAQIAYGCSGRLAPRAWGDRLRLRSYCMMQQLQSRVAGRRVDRLGYWDGEGYASPSQALVSGAWKDARLYVLLQGGLELWVNGHDRDPWEVRIGREVRTLPPFGWYAAGADLLEASITSDGRRVDIVQTPDYVYFDGRGSDQPAFGLASANPIVATVERGSNATLVHLSTPLPSSRIGLGDVLDLAERFGPATVFDAAGGRIDTVPGKTDEQGMTWYALPAGTRHVRISCLPVPGR